MRRQARPATAVIGAGRLAFALVPVMAEKGYPIVAVASRRIAEARRLSRRIGGARASTRPEVAASPARLVLLAVPDREIAPLAGRLARERDGWEGKTILHHAGALGTDPLAPLERAGASVGVLHPLQCLGMPDVAAAVLPGSRARIEGDARATRVARRLARDLGLVSLGFSRSWKPADRSAYHAAASLVSNDLVAILSLGTELLRSTGLSHAAALEALLPLVGGTLAHVSAGGLEGALTGPVARGDAETAAAHLTRIRCLSRGGAEAHRQLSRLLLERAERAGTIPAGRRTAVRRVLAGK